ncbi:MAG: GNAT family N-acetyltransferase [Vagococcus sp.]
MIIKQAILTEEEFDSVAAIWLEGNCLAHDFIDRNYWEMNYDVVRSLLPNASLYVCKEHGQIVGFLGLNGNDIEGLFVRDDCKRRGIGAQLLNSVKEDNSKLMLYVYEKNTQAIRFYLSQGFKQVCKQRDEINNENEYGMRWEI